MTDKELIERLGNIRLEGTQELCWEASDRIDVLVKERQAMAVRDAGYDVYAALEAKLAKAMEALRELVTCVEDGCYCSELKMATVLDEAHAALKELEAKP
ncbi:hypothetical protein UFOVP589_41 [uncultured Caudovirales phage]|uniref:Uncharacterized protein n=1 Tax=uncultured Caudovirales phage TaxID=2100421 RepID=A0A6J5MZG4_9CAUD|nr:hypothetical protein UFOVP589_41 [uncultured Caudovirales phage]